MITEFGLIFKGKKYTNYIPFQKHNLEYKMTNKIESKFTVKPIVKSLSMFIPKFN